MDQIYRVFLVEDSAAIRETLKNTLECSGPMKVVGYAETVDEAWGQLRDTPSDAVVIDLNLREGTGFDLLARLRENAPLQHLTRIVLTNYASPTFRQRALALGAHHFFDKSLEFDRAIEMLGTLAGQQARGNPT